MKYAVKAIWLIWLIAWSGRLMATISVHALNIRKGNDVPFEYFPTHSTAEYSAFGYITHSIGLIKKYCVLTHSESLARARAHIHRIEYMENVFNVLCIFAYYLWSSIFETSVICDVMLSLAVLLFTFSMCTCVCVFPVYFIFVSFCSGPSFILISKYPKIVLVSLFLCAATLIQCIFIINIRIFMWFIAQKPNIVESTNSRTAFIMQILLAQ